MLVWSEVCPQWSESFYDEKLSSCHWPSMKSWKDTRMLVWSEVCPQWSESFYDTWQRSDCQCSVRKVASLNQEAHELCLFHSKLAGLLQYMFYSKWSDFFFEVISSFFHWKVIFLWKMRNSSDFFCAHTVGPYFVMAVTWHVHILYPNIKSRPPNFQNSIRFLSTPI